MTKKIQAFAAICSVILFCVLTTAQEPAINVDARRHPNLYEAQRLIVKANEALHLAQRANEFDMNGHAENARNLLYQASQEIKAAAEAATNHR